MATNQDWLPHSHEALYKQAVQTQVYLGVPANRTRMGFAADTPLGKWYDTDFANVFIKYDSTHALWADEPNRTPLITDNFIAAEKAFIPLYRKLYGFIRENPLVTDTDLDAMGFPKRPSGEHKHHPAPTTRITTKVIATGPATLDIHYRDQGKESNAKPFGVHGAELVSRVSDEPVTDHDELTTSKFDTDTPFHLTFPDSQRGKTLYFSLRWENTTGEKGPWNEIQSAIIP
ncbi:MAG: hypothetical protein LBF81_03940 [Prevotellaceae bacterium]|jgi:hypothetical protein|nr:hypothetical protein [Prevotellaceae bacterium]